MRYAHFAPEAGRAAVEALDKILDYAWPGNVRELLNVVERAVSFADSNTIELGDLPDHVLSAMGPQTWADDTRIDEIRQSLQSGTGMAETGTFKDSKEQWVASFEKGYIEQLLRSNGNNISHAAREADIDRKYFRKLMKKYGITADGDSGDESE